MTIYDFNQPSDQQKLATLLQEHFRRSNIVPFFGSGFTRGCKACNGYVPSVSELKKFLIDFLSTVDDYT